jgi:hypothetical protein
LREISDGPALAAVDESRTPTVSQRKGDSLLKPLAEFAPDIKQMLHKNKTDDK